MKKTCLDCGKTISKYAERCVSCCNKNNTGRKYSVKTRAKMSHNQMGKNNSNWVGGLPKCRVCGKRQTVHHSTRCRACAMKDPNVLAKFAHNIKGTKNPRWQGGITPLTKAIRELPEMHEWRKQVFAKDAHECFDCGCRGYLEAHHIKAFNKLFKDFINIYNQFSVIDDKETLTRLALNYKPFFDVSNGKTLCKDCHEKYRIEARRDTQKTPESFLVFEIPSKEASKISDQTL